MLIRRDELRKELKDTTDNAVRATILESINSLNGMLGDAADLDDALVDKWERQLQEGKTPDLNEEV